ncbi:ABC transporter ATP-binding protein [Treponema pedis]|uniref:ABC transporter ATP-binding protein n=1 Tax=Treponema pedis TaxID=409322 RepID=UPI0004175D8D|nr:ABC transporter ATP-binding protein [Treponema pedis]
MQENTNLLEVKNLYVSFNTYAGEVKAVRNVNFHLKPGETLAFVGESGCGKTVTAKSLMRLLPKDSSVIKEGSKIVFDGKDVINLKKKELTALRGSDISMIFQDPMTSLNPTMRIGKQITEALILHRHLNKKEAKEEAIRLLQLVQIPNPQERFKAFPHELSGGMRQRVMIAIALSCNPKLLLADEPTTALDVTIQAQILDLLSELKQKFNTSIILVTHDLGVVANFANRIQVMYAGEIVEEGTTEEIFYNSRHPYTWALLNSIPKVHDKGSKLYSLGGTPPDLLLPLPGCPFVSRCDHAMKICKMQHPEITHHSETHRSWCWLEHESSGEHNWESLRKGGKNE